MKPYIAYFRHYVRADLPSKVRNQYAGYTSTMLLHASNKEEAQKLAEKQARNWTKNSAYTTKAVRVAEYIM